GRTLPILIGPDCARRTDGTANVAAPAPMRATAARRVMLLVMILPPIERRYASPAGWSAKYRRPFQVEAASSGRTAGSSSRLHSGLALSGCLMIEQASFKGNSPPIEERR